MKRREQPAFAKRNQSIQSINFSFKEKSELISLLISLALSLAGQPAGVSFMNLSIHSLNSYFYNSGAAASPTKSILFKKEEENIPIQRIGGGLRPCCLFISFF